jgi:hypothetical protein
MIKYININGEEIDTADLENRLKDLERHQRADITISNNELIRLKNDLSYTILSICYKASTLWHCMFNYRNGNKAYY